MYRVQQYREVNRTFGPYLPPHPMRGLGRGLGLYGLGAGDCSAEQSNLAYQQNDLAGKQAALASDPGNQDLQAQIAIAQQNVSAAQSDFNQCQAVGPAPPSPNATCPPGQYAEDTGSGFVCVPIPPDPNPPNPNPPNPNPPNPNPPNPNPPNPNPPIIPPYVPPKPAAKASDTNWPLIIGGVALLGVGGYLLMRKKH